MLVSEVTSLKHHGETKDDVSAVTPFHVKKTKMNLSLDQLLLQQ